MDNAVWEEAQTQFFRLGENWVRVGDIAAIAREGQDESRVYLRGSNVGIHVPLPPDAVIEKLQRLILRVTYERQQEGI